jgi:hypothetical protein
MVKALSLANDLTRYMSQGFVTNSDKLMIQQLFYREKLSMAEKFILSMVFIYTI